MASTTTRSPRDPLGAPPGAPGAEASADAFAEAFAGASGGAGEVLLLEVAGRLCAIPSGGVREVVRGAPVTPLPGTAGWLRGVAAVRGALLPVGDLLARRGAAPSLGTDEAHPSPAADAAAGGRDAWMIVLDDGRRAGALVGARVHVVTAAEPWTPEAGEPASDALAPPGLPTRGAVRLKGDVRAGSGTGLLRTARSRRPAHAARAVPAPAPSAAAPVALLDVAALLDDLYDEGG